MFAGRGTEACCSDPGRADRLGGMAGVPALFAVVRACCMAGARLSPRVSPARRDERRFTVLMAAAVAAWLVAECILFAGGPIVR